MTFSELLFKTAEMGNAIGFTFYFSNTEVALPCIRGPFLAPLALFTSPHPQNHFYIFFNFLFFSVIL